MDKEIVLNIDGSHNGYDYVDLGLPSGTKWATCNVGANNPEDEGLLFQFGSTDGYKYGDKNKNFITLDENEKITGKGYINPTASGTNYGKTEILKLEDDAAHVNMGGDWVMPTKYDLQELYDNTTKKVVTINDKRGMLFTSNINGKSIFFVFSGYWGNCTNKFRNGGYTAYLRSSEVCANTLDYSWILTCDSSTTCNISNRIRINGYSVRAVIKGNKTNDKKIVNEINLDYLL